jgi:hypothetical protein
MITKRITNGYRIYGDSFNQIAPEIERLDTIGYQIEGPPTTRFRLRELRMYGCCVDMVKPMGALETRLEGQR